MGIVVDAGQIAAEAASITDTITAAKEKINTLIEAIGAFVVDGGLSGQAYTGAKGYFAGYLPSLNALKAQMDSLLSAKSSMLSALGSCPHLGYADEDECNEEILSLTIQRSNFQRIKANAYTIEIIGGIATPVINYGLINYCDAQIYLIEARIKELEDTIEELITFDACSAFGFVAASCCELKKAIASILSFGGAPYLPGTAGAYKAKLKNMVTEAKILKELSCDANTIYVFCGVNYTSGGAHEPQILFDNDYPYDPDFSPTAQDYIDWVKWHAILSGAQTLGFLPDGCAAYERYLSGTGEDLSIDYEKAYRQDNNVRACVDVKMNEALVAALSYYEMCGQNSFSLSGDATATSPEMYPVTENWQKAIGAHNLWNSMDVSVDGSTMVIQLNVHEIDRYNFNKGMSDIATGTPDDVNGRFESAGWAKSFTTRGVVERTITVDLDVTNPSSINAKSDGVSISGIPRGKIGEGENR